MVLAGFEVLGLSFVGPTRALAGSEPGSYWLRWRNRYPEVVTAMINPDLGLPFDARSMTGETLYYFM